MGYFTDLEKALEQYMDADQVDMVKQAYLVARAAHKGQKRRSGEPYITHPVAAAMILSEMKMDPQSIMATLLHDVLEDTPLPREELAEQFGEDVAALVDGVSKLTKIKFESRAQEQAENFRKMVLAMVQDIRVIIVKLADRLHNMRTIDFLAPEKRRRIARETLEIYAPIANRLGMHQFYVELEDLGFQHRYPMRYKVLNEAVTRALGNRRGIIEEIESKIIKSLKQGEINTIRVYGRRKHLYSIYKKMQNKSASFAEIMDVNGFRVVVENVDACYRALGVVHQLFKPVPERFKDYIAIPKVNGYQSLHTTLFGPYGVPIEVQIRTRDMDEVANNGIAAHWIYKQKGSQTDAAQARAQQWIRSLLEMQQSTGSSLEFIETVKIDLFPDEVYVFTPSGDIMELPRGATAVDFAYAVHSDIGNACVAAKINRRLAPLSQQLTNGQSVEVITAPGAYPNPAWLNFVATGKARSNIRHFLKGQQRVESISLGMRLLNEALNEVQHSLNDYEQERLNSIATDLGHKDFDDLLHAIGLGNQVAQVVAQHFLHKEDEVQEAADIKSPSIEIRGTEGMVVQYAECCRPVPGDHIIGYLQAGRGIIVHVESCGKIDKLRLHHPERLINMLWEDDIKGEFLVDLLVQVANKRGVLALLASSIADAQANIDNISVDTSDGLHNNVFLTLTVRDRTHLARVMRRVRSLSPVVKITRQRKGQ